MGRANNRATDGKIEGARARGSVVEVKDRHRAREALERVVHELAAPRTDVLDHSLAPVRERVDRAADALADRDADPREAVISAHLALEAAATDVDRAALRDSLGGGDPAAYLARLRRDVRTAVHCVCPADPEVERAIAAQRAQAAADRRIEAEGTDAERAELRRRKAQRRERVISWGPRSRDGDDDDG